MTFDDELTMSQLAWLLGYREPNTWSERSNDGRAGRLGDSP
ncbi:MAG: hypothetical protein K0S56_614 [Microvirga sp.]|jgi:hypothetical protein|nr:hypothetical protein [Microvirga sp.]